MKQKYYFFLLTLFISSCYLFTEDNCKEGNQLNIAFIYSVQGTAQDTISPSIRGLGPDSIFSSGSFCCDFWTDQFYYKSKIKYTHLNPHANQTTFIFEYKGNLDTLTLTYKRQDVLESNECGFYLKIEDINVTYSSFRSYNWLNKNENKEIELYMD